ncbi:hypothetical protein K456DRAFT_43974 [Colletotrichum gloeosporioides 23]|nr:hypothetical protein K456DRAFT_43974 [Colletotrichum gloeosporioides 23]
MRSAAAFWARRYVRIPTSLPMYSNGTSHRHEPSDERDRYVFIDFRRAIEATRSILTKVQTQISQNDASSSALKTYKCPSCAGTWELIDVIDNMDSEGHFLCKSCINNRILTEEPDLQQQLPRFNEQCRPFFSALQHFESVNNEALPLVNFEDLYSRRYVSGDEHEKRKRVRHGSGY